MRGSIVSRVVWATVAVSVLSAVTLAAVTTLTARILWRDSLRRSVEETAAGVLREIQQDAREDGLSLDRAAPDSIEESENAGFQVEVWKGGERIAHNTAGPPVGPWPRAGNAADSSRWIVATHPMPGGLTVLVALDQTRGLIGMALFRRSLAYSIPFCILVAIWIGRSAGRRAARPLRDFTNDIVRIRELRARELPEMPNAPREVHDLERSFRSLLDRLRQSLARELEFAGNASHELRTPLTRIRLLAERAREDAGLRGREELSSQLHEIDQLVRLVDALLVLARDVEAGIPVGEGVNLADLVRERARHVFRDSSAVRVEAPDEVMVRGDENLLSIAIENLLDNARKYTPAGGQPVVAVSEKDALARVDLFSPGARLPASGEEHLFERFVRGDEATGSREGHGLGLSLARHIAELHKGTLGCREEARNGVGGALFELSLPRWTFAHNEAG